jgi:glycosyltransferase involved in cell wall biosynthesis
VRTVSAAVGQELREWGVPSEKLSIIPSFYLDHGLIGKAVAPPKSYDIAFCARLVGNKNLLSVIEALRFLPDARLLIIGDGPQRAEVERHIQSIGAQNRVTFLGWLPTLDAVLEAILTARTFVMPSLSEGGPRSALEAMACGMPIVATRVGVMPEVIEDGENGLFTDGSPKDIAEKVGILLRDEKKREHMGKAARKILDRFERGKLVEKYAEFLKGIAKGR